jgi:hypothetical protein
MRASGLSVTEFMLRIMAWLCTSNNQEANKTSQQMCIVTGPNIDFATKLIKRMKNIFGRKLGITFDNNETAIELDGCTIEAYRQIIWTHTGLENPSCLYLKNIRTKSEYYVS